MKKLTILSILMLLAFFTFAQAQSLFKQNNVITVFNDDFESYTVNTFPTSGGWYLRYNGAGDSYQVVVNSEFHSGSKSMQMKGAPSWTAHMEKAVDLASDVIYWQGWVKPTGNDGGLGLIDYDTSPGGGYYGVIYFDHGKIWCQIGSTVADIQEFSVNQWYKIKLKYDHTDKSVDVWINDILKVSSLHAASIPSTYYKQFYMYSEHDGNLFYFDDIEVWYENSSDGLVAYYPFNGDAHDASGNGNHGDVQGAILTTGIKDTLNSAYYFDGTGDYIDCGNGSSLQISGDITVCAWVKLQPTSHGQVIVNKYHLNSNKGWLIEATSDGRVCFDGRPGPGGEMSNSGFSPQSIYDNTWHFLVGQRQNSTWKIYVDGNLSSQSEGSNGDFTNSINLMIGVQSDRPSDGAAFSNGVIDNVRIYNRALSDEEIRLIFDEGSTPVELSSFTAETADGSIVLNWTTQSETENYGFHVYRSNSRDSDYEKITSEIIPGRGNSDQAYTYALTDYSVLAGNTYYYKLADVDFSGNMKFHGPIVVSLTMQPEKYALSQNYPNPFNPETTINFSLEKPGKVSLKIFNLQGKLVQTLVDERKLTGNYSVLWNGTDQSGLRVASGAYICNMKVNEFEQSKRLIFVK